MQYFFQIVCKDEVFEDENGRYFYCCDDSVEHATRIASELRHDDDHYVDCAVRVIDQHKREVARVPVSGGNNRARSSLSEPG